MHKIATTLIIALFIGFSGQANACQMRGAVGDAEAAETGAGATSAQEVMAQRMALMQERDALLLETVQLLKDVAKDKESKAKAEALEKRIQANIEKHSKLHATMMGGGMGMGPDGQMMHKKDGCCGGKDKPCPMKGAAPAEKKAN